MAERSSSLRPSTFLNLDGSGKTLVEPKGSGRHHEMPKHSNANMSYESQFSLGAVIT